MPHTPLTLPQRCCRLCQKPTHQGQRTAEVPGTPAKASNRPERGMAKNPAKEPERSSPGGRYPARTRKPPERLDLLKALTVPVTDKAECAERQTQKHSLVLFSFRRPRVRHHERSSVLISYCLNRYHVVPIRVEVLDHNFFALHAQKRGCLLGKGTGGGGSGRKSEGSTADTSRKRPERPWTTARTMEVLRRCPLAIAQRLVHCAIAVLTRAESQGQCPSHCC